MKVTVLKEANKSPLLDPESFTPGSNEKVFQIVKTIIEDCREGKEAKVLEYAQKLDKWPADKTTVLVSAEEIKEQTSDEFVPQQVKKDIQLQLKRVRDFAKLQKAHCGSDFEVTDVVGEGKVTYGQKVMPMRSVGCYVPGGRYSHISSAIMTIATAKVAGVTKVVAASPPMQGTTKIQAATLYAMQLAGADYILCCGGAQAIGAMAFGLFLPKNPTRPLEISENKEQGEKIINDYDPDLLDGGVDILVGPGNSFVAEAKRLLYGKCAIDMFAGPTEILILADETSDPMVVATDLVSQAEHGPTSPAWLITTSKSLGLKVKELCVELADKLDEDCVKANKGNNIAPQSWKEYGEILLVDTLEDMCRLSDYYAAEHLEVLSTDVEALKYMKDNLICYGSLFLGEETCVTYGDKCSGPNHALPTLRAAKYTGGLSVDKFLKKTTFQTCDIAATKILGPLAARISRYEGMEGHARSADVRVYKYLDEKTAKSVDLGTIA